MSGRILRMLPPDEDIEDVDKIIPEDVSEDKDGGGMDFDDNEHALRYDQSIVAPSNVQRFANPVVQPQDTGSRLQRLEIYLERVQSDDSIRDQHITTLHRSIDKHRQAIQSSYATIKSHHEKLISLYDQFMKAESQIKGNTSDVRDINDIQLVDLKKKMVYVIKEVRAIKDHIRNQFEELKNYSDELSDALDSIAAMNNDHTVKLTEYSNKLLELDSRLNAVTQLLNDNAIVKRTIIKLGTIAITIIAGLYTIYKTGVIGAIFRAIISDAGIK